MKDNNGANFPSVGNSDIREANIKALTRALNDEIRALNDEILSIKSGAVKFVTKGPDGFLFELVPPIGDGVTVYTTDYSNNRRATLRAGRYFAYTGDFVTPINEASGGVILFSEKENASTQDIDEAEALEITQVTFCYVDNEKDVCFALSNPETREFVTLQDLLVGVDMLSTIRVVGGSLGIFDEQAPSEQAPIEKIPLAMYSLDKQVVNHSFMIKTLDQGFKAIADGEQYYYNEPKNSSSKSREIYRLEGISERHKAFYDVGGNDELLKKIIGVIFSIINDPRAEKIITNGRVWITSRKIATELTRTEGGAFRAKDYEKLILQVDSALLALSTCQISGSTPDGELLNSFYLINAVKRESIAFEGKTYKNVWGVQVDAKTINDYTQKYLYEYPLLKMDRYLKADEVWIETYLKDVLNIARNNLYYTDKANNVKTRKRADYTITRSWGSIFDKKSPYKALTSRQKQQLIEKFEGILTILANMDKKGELREGMPLSISAHSERDSGKGRGRGAWKSLVITCSRYLHEPDINLS